jgi:hypothetical protein
MTFKPLIYLIYHIVNYSYRYALTTRYEQLAYKTKRKITLDHNLVIPYGITVCFVEDRKQ